MAGRWSLLPELEPDATRRAHASAEGLLERHGVVTRGAVASERVPGGFAGVYKVLSAFEDSGRCRRGYFVGALGAAQFGVPGRRRPAALVLQELTAPPGRPVGHRSRPRRSATAVALAATDPANPYGAALPWPERPVAERRVEQRRTGPAARPARWWCWSTASSCSTSSAAAGRC